ncbi:type VI secretion system tube protein TssD [Ulvibacter litoralis]|uniref:Uncharacterized protein n=1 Tax=Ulvibacter litoralis TaxID=227084 RepID=A0A1G7J1E5_9FLAO|nr:type VI secretion system tube protein TssD [Ulvibacter litoralis]GHC60481.1 hypothetical protein GCM10008083_26770 [Ulvibacter litoralis]SDF18688.1 hypothetical protein SAMN05421855_10836 [Ulvibacter litoralis]
MSIIARLHVDDKQFNILNYQLAFKRPYDFLGKPSSKTIGGLFEITLESTKDELFSEWAIQPNMMKQAKIVQSSVRMDGKSRTFDLIDVHCLKNKVSFNSVNNRPMTNRIILSPAILKLDGLVLFEKFWKVTDLNTQNSMPPIPYHKAELISYFITDENGNELKEYETGAKIQLHIETKNAVGKNISISIKDKTHDFLHNGQRLENDTLSAYTITTDLEKLELDIIAQQN